MNDNEKKSLCEVTEYNERLWLIRLCDIKDEKITPFTENKNRPDQFENRKHIIYNSGDENDIGRIGIWNWSYEHNHADSNKDYTRVLREDLNTTLYEIVELNEYFEEFIKQHKLYKIAENNLETALYKFLDKKEYILITKEDLEQFFEEDFFNYKFKDKVIYLKKFVINKNEIIEINDKLYYNKTKLPDIFEKEYIKSKNEIITHTIISIPRKTVKQNYSNIISVNKFLELKTVLKTITSDSEIKNKLNIYMGWNESEIESELDKYLEYIENNEEYLFDDKYLSEIILSLKSFRDKAYTNIRNEWEKENEKYISEIKKRKKEIEVIEKEYSKINNILKVKEAEKTEYQKLIDSLSKKSESMLKDIDNNISDYLSNHIVLKNIANKENNSVDKDIACTYIEREKYIDEEDNEFSIEDDMGLFWIDFLSKNLRKAGISQKFSEVLANVIYTLKMSNIQILFIGANSYDIAKAVTCTFHCKNAKTVVCNKKDNVIIDGSELDDVNIFRNPFYNDFLERNIDLIKSCDNSYNLFTTNFIEDLSLQPDGILRYMYPIFTDLLVVDNPENTFSGAKMGKEYSDCSIMNDNTEQNIENIISIPSINRRCNTIINSIKKIDSYSDNEKRAYIHYFVYFPYLYLYNRTEKYIKKYGDFTDISIPEIKYYIEEMLER